MVRAIYQNGQVRLTDPVPPRWTEGQELSVSESAARIGLSARAEFDRLTQQWKHDTRASSSMDDEVTHPAYQRIIGMGPLALPWIVDDLKRTNAHWFAALAAITGENPVPDELIGHIKAMADCWVRWYEGRLEAGHA